MVKEGLSIGFKLLPFISEDQMLGIMNSQLNDLWPDARRFLEKLLVVSKRKFQDASPNCREKALTGFLANTLLYGIPRRDKYRDEHGYTPPLTILISPSMRCNLHCFGCFASEYNKADDLDISLVDRVFTEGKDMGVYFYTVLGGEPFIREDLFDLYEKHNDAYFQVFTNGTYIDEKMADRIAKAGNLYIAFSIEGLEEYTRKRRGPGVFEKIMRAMDLLRERGVFFGYSTMITRENNDLVQSDEFVDCMVNKGCIMGWYFAYVPVGRTPRPELMPTPEQRINRIKRLREIRATKDIVVSDFWNDGPIARGCIAGRKYIHINNTGEVEPCVFCHFATENIKDKSLGEIFASDFFREIRSRQPYTENLMRPCMIIDSPQVLREVVAKTGAHPTHPDAQKIIEPELAASLDQYAQQYAELCAPAWTEYIDVEYDGVLTHGA